MEGLEARSAVVTGRSNIFLVVLASRTGSPVGHAAGQCHGGQNRTAAHRSRRDLLVWACARKWVVTVRRICLFAALAVLALTLFDGTASATPSGWRVAPYVEIGSGTITSTVQDVTTSMGTVFGTPILRGTTSGSEVAASPPPPCSPSAGSPVTGSVTTTASDGSQLNFSLSGTVCESATTASYTRYLVTATVTVTGGTGEFANATGGGRQYSIVTLYPNGDGTEGPFTSFLYGVIRLAG